MMRASVSRRGFLAAGAAMASAAMTGGAAPAGLKLGVMDGVLGLATDPACFAKAKELGVAGVQVTLGRPAKKGTSLPLSSKALQEKMLAASAAAGVPIVSTYLDVLHDDCLKNSDKASQWVLDGIQITKALKAKILMPVFFGKCELATHGGIEKAVAAFKDLAPAALDEGVTIGMESLLTAKQSLFVLEQVDSPALKVYYDVGNAANMIGVDPASELRIYGAQNLCQIHFKDKAYLGQGKVDFPAVYAALNEIGYQGYGVLETNAPTKDTDADLKRNLEFLASL
ncbi:MAG: sugar phosphate isomerase/epimerase [Bryobacterales bacterium]|jgi:sugar phosphate isomerase/epimerase|nr:sugar phosphate isomerase/epimerase [Bryobacterales bacterium]